MPALLWLSHKVLCALPRMRSDDVHLDIDKAMGRFEADTRALRHDSKKKRVSGGGGAPAKGGGKKGGKGK